MKSFIFTSLSALALAAVTAASCASPVTLTGNAFANRSLSVNIYYATKVAQAVARIQDHTLAVKAAQIGSVGIDQISVIPTIDAMIRPCPCDQIIGFVIYNLPGRDCSVGASSGELPAGSIARYMTDFIDPIGQIILANPNTAIALLIEPDSLPNVVTNMNLPACQAAAQGYKGGIVYALAQLNLPNVVMYIDAGNAGWLGWVDNLAPGAKLIADVWNAAGSPSQVKGITTNVANWDAWSQVPGEFEGNLDAQWNKAQDEQRYVHLLGDQLAALGAPNHAIVDTSSNGITEIRLAWGDWCNTGDDLADAFVWVKLGGESDGVSDPSQPRYDSTCGQPDAGEWNQAYFEALVANAIDLPGNNSTSSNNGNSTLIDNGNSTLIDIGNSTSSSSGNSTASNSGNSTSSNIGNSTSSSGNCTSGCGGEGSIINQTLFGYKDTRTPKQKT